MEHREPHKHTFCPYTQPRLFGLGQKVKTSFSKIVSMIRKYYNHKLQTKTNPWHCENETYNNHETPGRQTRQSNQLSLPHQDDCKTRMDTK